MFLKDDSSNLEEGEAFSSSNDSLEDVKFGIEEAVDLEEQNDNEIENIRDDDFTLVCVASKKHHFYPKVGDTWDWNHIFFFKFKFWIKVEIQKIIVVY